MAFISLETQTEGLGPTSVLSGHQELTGSKHGKYIHWNTHHQGPTALSKLDGANRSITTAPNVPEPKDIILWRQARLESGEVPYVQETEQHPELCSEPRPYVETLMKESDCCSSCIKGAVPVTQGWSLAFSASNPHWCPLRAQEGLLKELCDELQCSAV